jgi:chaperonin GroEL
VENGGDAPVITSAGALVDALKVIGARRIVVVAPYMKPLTELVVDYIRNSKSETEGFDAQTEEYVDMIKAGIIDPAKVTRVALENAASVAGLILTSEASIYEQPKAHGSTPQMPGGGMSGMDMM